MGYFHVSDGSYESNGDMLTIGEYTRTIDNFEDNRQVLKSRYRGDLSDYRLDSSLVSQGSQALFQTHRNQHKEIDSLPGDGLPYYPTPDDRFRFRIAVRQERADARLSFFKTSYGQDDQYEFHLSDYGNAIALWAKPSRYEKERLAYEQHNPVYDRFYEFEVDSKLVGGDVVLDLSAWQPNGNRVINERVRDSKYTFTGGGIRWASYKQASFDHARTI